MIAVHHLGLNIFCASCNRLNIRPHHLPFHPPAPPHSTAEIYKRYVKEKTISMVPKAKKKKHPPVTVIATIVSSHASLYDLANSRNTQTHTDTKHLLTKHGCRTFRRL